MAEEIKNRDEVHKLYEAAKEAELQGEHETAQDLRLVAARLALDTGHTVSLDEALEMLGVSREELLRDAENIDK